MRSLVLTCLMKSEMMLNKLLYGDCLKVMLDIPDHSIDMILCDLPYGVTRNKWDSVIPLPELWSQYKRIAKPNAAIILFGQDKFSAALMMSNLKMHRYNLIWQKTSPTGYLNAKKMPLRSHEDLLVFYSKKPIYNPQKTTGHPRKVSTVHHKRDSKKTTNYGDHGLTTYDSTERYPKSILTFATNKQKSALHPTQKPVALLEYLIKTYTNPGAVVLDTCAGSGSTGVACNNTGRYYILIEKDPQSYDICFDRLK